MSKHEFDAEIQEGHRGMENTPSTGKSLEYLIDRAQRMALRYAEVSSYRLNPNRDVWEGIVRGIGRQAHTFGWPYCP